MKLFVYSVIGVVAALLVVGLVLVGSPKKERDRQLDDRRVSDLQQIQSQVVSYWQRTGRLPGAVDTLGDPLSGFTVPRDPETSALYEYRVVASTTFQLCATFAQGSVDDGLRATPSAPVLEKVRRLGNSWDVWNHGTGHSCFERTIDPTLYPPVKQSAATGGCVITGCSGQVCAESEVVTTCDFQPQYACYKQYSRCERQVNGQCGWRETPELERCRTATNVPAVPAPQ